jgi:two-component sensor histidine kinase/HAMP domain-containing protein
MAFRDRQGTEERLRYLQTIPQAMKAYVLDEQGEVFAVWQRTGGPAVDWDAAQALPISLGAPYFTVAEPVADAGQSYGRVAILASTAVLRSQLFEYLGALGLVAAIVIPLAWLLAYRLQAGVSGAIRRLASAAQHISTEDDLAVRVTPETSDEIATLYRAFNAMMDRVQARQEERDRANAALERARDELEDTVALRTEQYRSANEALEREFTRLREAEARISRALAEKETLLREVHHRVKNNLQVVHSLLSLQARPGDGSAASLLLEDARQRVRTIALVHESLYQSNDLADVPAAEFLERVAQNVASVFHASAEDIRLTVQADDIRLDVDQAVPLGLIINELVTNAYKYAFDGRQNGTLEISLRRDTDNDLVLIVDDDGPGLPPDLDVRRPGSLGLMLVQALAGQLRGRVEVGPGPGSRIRVRFSAGPGG